MPRHCGVYFHERVFPAVGPAGPGGWEPVADGDADAFRAGFGPARPGIARFPYH